MMRKWFMVAGVWVAIIVVVLAVEVAGQKTRSPSYPTRDP
jgi:hypothetical protein